MKTKKIAFEDINIDIKILLSAMWTSVMFLAVYDNYFELYVPGKVEGLINGKNILNNPYNLLYATLQFTFPSLMIFLSLILKPKLNRILNIIVAGNFIMISFLVAIFSISEWKIFYISNMLIGIVITLIILYKALNWRRIN